MATAFLRTVILYLLLIAGLRLSGKRQIGELEPIELVLTLLISDLASVPMQDFGIPLLNGVVPILALIALSTLFSCISLRNVRFRSLVCGEPALVIKNGQIRQEVMHHNRLTLDELMEELRGQGVLDINTVKYAVLETSGHLSVLLRADQQPLTARQMAVAVEDDVFLPTVVINDGRIPFQGPPREVFRHGAELERMGLGVPQMTRVFSRLRAMGVDIDASVYTIPQAKETILRRLREKGVE